MATKKKMLQAAAGVGGAGLDITEVFSTYLYKGTAANQTINNNIDLSGEGGLVWIKGRTNAQSHGLFDTERGVSKALASDANWAEFTYQGVNAFYSNGFRVGYQNEYNQSGLDYASWTFRKAPKFFEVVTYTGNDNSGSSEQTITHNLNGTVGSIFIKKTTGTHNWWVWHRSLSATTNGLYLNATNEEVTGPTGSNYYVKDVTDTSFKVGGQGTVNGLGETYVAYLFAHNDGDGDFGPSGDADIIKCGSYTGNGSSNGPVIDLGFEPQWLLVKNASIYSNANWYILDAMRGWDVGGTGSGTLNLRANLTDPEQAMQLIDPNSTGFQVKTTGSFINGSGSKIVYMAIRRGPLAQPESGTEVFETKTYSGTGAAQTLTTSLNGSDMALTANRSTSGALNPGAYDRLRGDEYLQTSNTSAAIGSDSYGVSVLSNKQNTVDVGNFASTSGQTYVGQIFKRAPGFCDVVAYTGTGSATATNLKSHNLTVPPEMVILKNRSGSFNWMVWHKDMNYNAGESYINKAFMHLNTTAAATLSSNYWSYNSNPQMDADYFSLGSTYDETNNPSYRYIAYLFATVPGVSKVGSYTGNGTSQTIDCGFTSGARFILVKRTDSTGDWYVWDTERGIVAGNDPHLSLNTTAAEVTSDDSIDPDNSGFIVNQVGATNINVSSASYIFYAIA